MYYPIIIKICINIFIKYINRSVNKCLFRICYIEYVYEHCAVYLYCTETSYIVFEVK